MKMFVIDDSGKIAAVQPGSATEGQTTFTSEKQLASLTSEWPSGRLVEIFNQLPGVAELRKFTDRKTAVVRIWKAVQTLEPAVAPQAAQKRAKKVRSAGRTLRNPTRLKPTKRQPCWNCSGARAERRLMRS